MRLTPGSFITVPSRGTLLGLNPIAQCLYMWLCSHANDSTGESWPSIKTLSEEVGCSERSIDNMLKVLEEKGLVKKKNRFIKGEQTTNTYHVIVKEGGAGGALPSAGGALPLAQEVRTELKPVLTKTKKSSTNVEAPRYTVEESRPVTPRAPKDRGFEEAVRALLPVNKMAERLRLRPAEKESYLVIKEAIGHENLIRWLAVLPETNGTKGFPTITSLSHFAQHYEWLKKEYAK